MKICVVGLGQVGLPTASYILDSGFEVWGYDIDLTAVKNARRKGIKASNNWNELLSMDVYVICASTALKKGLPDLSSIFEICDKIARVANLSTLVSIESTIIPGTSRRIYEEIFRQNINLVHVPHRYWSEDPINHGVKQLRVMGAINQESLKIGLKFYKELLKIPVYVVSSIEVAEMSKIAENSYRFVQIAFAEELRMICEQLGLNFNEVRAACNTKWNTNILEARDGVGGHCLPKDIRYLNALASTNSLIKGSITADEKYKKWFKNKYKSGN
jgi:UDP-N-acetyl-D-mannosaminuronic acid dehydrogenase